MYLASYYRSINRAAYADLWGEGSVPYSENVIRAYVGRYATPSRLGHVPTDEDFARIHRGGSNGWNSSSTQEYWSQVSAAINLGKAGMWHHMINTMHGHE